VNAWPRMAPTSSAVIKNFSRCHLPLDNFNRPLFKEFSLNLFEEYHNWSVVPRKWSWELENVFIDVSLKLHSRGNKLGFIDTQLRGLWTAIIGPIRKITRCRRVLKIFQEVKESEFEKYLYLRGYIKLFNHFF